MFEQPPVYWGESMGGVRSNPNRENLEAKCIFYLFAYLASECQKYISKDLNFKISSRTPFSKFLYAPQFCF